MRTVKISALVEVLSGLGMHSACVLLTNLSRETPENGLTSLMWIAREIKQRLSSKHCGKRETKALRALYPQLDALARHLAQLMEVKPHGPAARG